MKRALSKNPKVVLVGLVSLFGLIIVIAYFLLKSGQSDSLQKDQIRIERGGKIVTVNENGLVEYRSENGVFYETWDSDRTSHFFTSVRETARRYLANPQNNKSGNNSYKITLWLDGELVVIYVSEDDEIIDLLDEVYEEFDEYPDGDLSDIFDEDDEDNDNESDTVFTPSPTSILNPQNTTIPTPTGSASGGGGGTTVQTPPDCDLYNSLVTQRTVISNTICQTEQP